MIIMNRLQYVLSPQFDIYEQVAKVVSGRVADIGFGTGFGSHLLTQKADEVCGYDIDKDFISFAKRAFPLKGLSFTYGDIQKGIKHDPFDFVVMIDVLEHILREGQVLKNVKKLLETDGNLILSTPNRLSRYRKSSNHIREYAPEELRNVLGEVFKYVELKDYQLKPLVNQFENPILAVCR